MTTEKNFSKTPTPSIADGHYLRCNFSQLQPVDSGGGVMRGVRLFPGDDTPRTFEECTLTNCEVPPGSTIIRGARIIRETFIILRTDTITIDGVPEDVDVIGHRTHGTFGEGMNYIDLPAPIEEEV